MKSFQVIAKIKIQDKDGVWHKYNEKNIVRLELRDKDNRGFEVKRI